MFITQKYLSRRTLLRSAGSVLALPFLDAMVPAMARGIRRLPRLGFVYVPHGAVMSQWTPAQAGRDFSIKPILQPLASWRDRLNIVSGLSHRTTDPAAAHTLGPATWLSGVRPRRTRSTAFRAGVTADQYAADYIGRNSRVQSLQLAAEECNASTATNRDYNPIYASSLSWRSNSRPLPMHTQPRLIFERLFNVRCARSGILDSHLGQISALSVRLSRDDRVALDHYLEEIREVEQRVYTSSEASFEFDEQVELLLRLIALAWQTDACRVFTFMMARETSRQRYPHIGVSEEHHAVSHHQNRADKLAQCATIQRHHVNLFSRFIRRLDSVADGDGSLLDNSLILYGSGMSNSNAHDSLELPNVLIGGAGGRIKGGYHTVEAKHTPMTNLLLTILQKHDIPIDTLGDSTGTLSRL